MPVNRLSPGCGCCDDIPPPEWCDCDVDRTFKATIEIDFIVDSYVSCAGFIPTFPFTEYRDLQALNGVYEYFFVRRSGVNCSDIEFTSITETIGTYTREELATSSVTTPDFDLIFSQPIMPGGVGLRAGGAIIPGPNRFGLYTWTVGCDEPYITAASIAIDPPGGTFTLSGNKFSVELLGQNMSCSSIKVADIGVELSLVDIPDP